MPSNFDRSRYGRNNRIEQIRLQREHDRAQRARIEQEEAAIRAQFAHLQADAPVTQQQRDQILSYAQELRGQQLFQIHQDEWEQVRTAGIRRPGNASLSAFDMWNEYSRIGEQESPMERIRDISKVMKDCSKALIEKKEHKPYESIFCTGSSIVYDGHEIVARVNNTPIDIFLLQADEWGFDVKHKNRFNDFLEFLQCEQRVRYEGRQYRIGNWVWEGHIYVNACSGKVSPQISELV